MGEKKETEHHKKDEEAKESHISKKSKKVSVWKIATVVLGVALIVSVFMLIVSVFMNRESAPLTGEAVAEKAINYLNTYVLSGSTAVLEGIEEENGLYKIKLTVDGKYYESYATKDGKLLFPSSINIEEATTMPPASTTSYPKSDTPDILMFTMSYCPYGNQAETGIKPVADLLGEKANIEPHYVIYPNYGGGGPDHCFDEESNYCSMHGIAELNQDIRELCIYKYQKGKFWNYISIVNEKCNVGNIESCWAEAAEQAGVDAENVNTCFEDEALELLEAEAELNAQYRISGSPTIFVNEQIYSGARTPEAYKAAVCSAFNEEPAECGQALSAEGASASGQC